MKEFTLTKKISKQGNQTMILIPAVLKGKLRHNSLVEVRIRVLEDAIDESDNAAKMEE